MPKRKSEKTLIIKEKRNYYFGKKVIFFCAVKK